MFKKFLLGFAVVIIILGGLVVWDFYENKNIVENPTISDYQAKLADPDLLYASSSSYGLCDNSAGEEGGCYFRQYLYNSGKLVEETGWEAANGKKSSSPSERTLEQSVVNKIIEKIRSSGIMAKDCPPEMIVDAGWSYQVTLDGDTRAFSNPPDVCKEIFDAIDFIINPTRND